MVRCIVAVDFSGVLAFLDSRRRDPADSTHRRHAGPVVLTEHGDERVDDWYWLRERDDPEVVAYLEAENAYTDAVLAPSPAAATTGSSTRSRRASRRPTRRAPVPDGPWEYFTRTRRGTAVRGALPATARRRRGPSETVLLDENVARRRPRLLLARRASTSPPTTASLAYAIDTNGGERYQLRFRDLDDRRRPRRRRRRTSLRPRVGQRRAHLLLRPARRRDAPVRRCGGTRSARDASDDVLVFQEDDERFYVGVGRTRRGRFVVIDDRVEDDVRGVVRPDRGAARRAAG